MQTMKIFMAFVLMLILGFFAVGFANSVNPPTAGTAAGNMYTNLTSVVGLTNNASYAGLLVIAMAMVFSAIVVLMNSVKRRRA